ncbi:MAG: putative collagen-binding domain-containing protein [Spirosomataceae bacterium]
MKSMDEMTADAEDFVFGKESKIYAVYLPKGGNIVLPLPKGKWLIQWFNPRTGGKLSAKKTFSGMATAPDNNDWVALINQ